MRHTSDAIADLSILVERSRQLLGELRVLETKLEDVARRISAVSADTTTAREKAARAAAHHPASGGNGSVPRNC